MVYADHIEGSGIALFEKASELDLEGIVAKLKNSPYHSEGCQVRGGPSATAALYPSIQRPRISGVGSELGAPKDMTESSEVMQVQRTRRVEIQ